MTVCCCLLPLHCVLCIIHFLSIFRVCRSLDETAIEEKKQKKNTFFFFVQWFQFCFASRARQKEVRRLIRAYIRETVKCNTKDKTKERSNKKLCFVFRCIADTCTSVGVNWISIHSVCFIQFICKIKKENAIVYTVKSNVVYYYRAVRVPCVCAKLRKIEFLILWKLWIFPTNCVTVPFRSEIELNANTENMQEMCWSSAFVLLKLTSHRAVSAIIDWSRQHKRLQNITASIRRQINLIHLIWITIKLHTHTTTTAKIKDEKVKVNWTTPTVHISTTTINHKFILFYLNIKKRRKKNIFCVWMAFICFVSDSCSRLEKIACASQSHSQSNEIWGENER